MYRTEVGHGRVRTVGGGVGTDLNNCRGKLPKTPCSALATIEPYTHPWPTLAASRRLFPRAKRRDPTGGFSRVWTRRSPRLGSHGGGGRCRRRRRRPLHRPEAGAVVELGGVALRPRRYLLPLPRPWRRSSQDRGVAEQGLPPDPRGGHCGPLRDKAAGSLLPEWSGFR